MTTQSIPGIVPSYSDLILNLFRSLPEGSEVILFGSRAKGNFREGSDIDLAIKGKRITQQHRDQCLVEYEDLYLPWRLDLVIYEFITESALREHIDRIGKCLSQI